MSFINSLGALLQETLGVLGMSPLANINKLVQLALEGKLSELCVVGYSEDGDPLFQGNWSYSNLNERETYAFLHFDCNVSETGWVAYVKYYDKRNPTEKIGGAMFELNAAVQAGKALDHVQPILLKG